MVTGLVVSVMFTMMRVFRKFLFMLEDMMFFLVVSVLNFLQRVSIFLSCLLLGVVILLLSAGMRFPKLIDFGFLARFWENLLRRPAPASRPPGSG